MIRFYLGEEPILPNVPTFCCDDADDRAHVLANLERAGDQAGERVRRVRHRRRPRGHRRRAARLRRDGSGPIPGTTSRNRWCRCRRCRPCATGVLEPRHVDLRPFSLLGGESYVTCGGLTRVARERGSLDRQLVAGRRVEGHLGRRHRSPTRDHLRITTGAHTMMLLSRTAEDLYWLGRNIERAESRCRAWSASTRTCWSTSPSTSTRTGRRCSTVTGSQERASPSATSAVGEAEVDHLPDGRRRQPRLGAALGQRGTGEPPGRAPAGATQRVGVPEPARTSTRSTTPRCAPAPPPDWRSPSG